MSNTIEITIAPPANATDSEIVESAVELADIADKLHRAMGGGGLEVADDSTRKEPGHAASNHLSE